MKEDRDRLLVVVAEVKNHNIFLKNSISELRENENNSSTKFNSIINKIGEVDKS
jgi:hypothetical protein